jgi:hypothetical protein
LHFIVEIADALYTAYEMFHFLRFDSAFCANGFWKLRKLF